MKMMMFLAAAVLAATGAAAGAVAQTNSAAPKATAPTAKPATPAAKPMAPKPAAAAKPAKAPAGRMVAATTKTGKKITYDCSKKGNLTKKACKA